MSEVSDIDWNVYGTTHMMVVGSPPYTSPATGKPVEPYVEISIGDSIIRLDAGLRGGR